MTTQKKSYDWKKITSPALAAKALGYKLKDILPDLSCVPKEFRKKIIAEIKMSVVNKAINQGWTPDYHNYEQKKWWAWFYQPKKQIEKTKRTSGSGFVFDVSIYVFGDTLTDVPSRLVFESAEKAKHAAKHFAALYEVILR